MKIDKSSYATGKIEVIVPNGAETVTLYAHELGYLEIANNISGQEENRMAKLIVAAVTDKAGNRFTLQEALNLKKEVADPLIEAVLKVNSIGKEKN